MKFRYLLLWAFAYQCFAADCSTLNQPKGPFFKNTADVAHHISGLHNFVAMSQGTCSYKNPVTGSYCDSVSTADPQGSTGSDTGVIDNLIGFHVHGFQQKNGTASSGGNNPSVAHSENAISYLYCLTPGCNVGITIDSLYHITNPSGAIWSDSFSYDNTCPARLKPTSVGGGGGGCVVSAPVPSDDDPNVTKPCIIPPISPVVVATKHGAFKRLSDPKTKCVRFDLKGNGSPDCYSWPEHGSGIGFLALDVNGDGIIESGKELFGDFTPQPMHPNPKPNGFLALAEWDMPSNGGNIDTAIDSQDAVWPKLKIWIDEHCYLDPQATCVSRPNELHALNEFNIDSISLIYEISTLVDDKGNEFRYYALINPDKENSDPVHHAYHHKYKYHAQRSGRDDRRAYDVFLVAKPN